jgi:hypothetical protein
MALILFSYVFNHSTTALWETACFLKMFTYQNPFAISCIKLIQDVEDAFSYVRPMPVVSESVGCKICAKPATATTCISSLAEGFSSISNDSLPKDARKLARLRFQEPTVFLAKMYMPILHGTNWNRPDLAA